jgi:alkylhydroperoxidase family enzyme
VTAHAEFLRAATDDRELARRIKAGFRTATLSEADRSLLEFVETLTLAPWALSEARVERLRQGGFEDIEILHAVLGTAHFNYLNRMADGLGIRLDYESDLPQFEVPQEPLPGASGPSEPWEATLPGWLRLPTGPGDAGVDVPERLMRAVAANPKVQALAREWHRFQLQGTEDLDHRLRGRVALLVAARTRSSHGIDLYRGRLEGMGDREAAAALARGELPEALPQRERTLLLHALRLTETPWTVGASQIEDLRGVGCDDRAILRLTMLAAYMAFECRVALGLGVPREEASPPEAPRAHA